MGVNFKKKRQNLFFQKVEKSQNKVGVAEEIGCKNDTVMKLILIIKGKKL